MKRAINFFLGSRSDWHLTRPWIRAPKLALHWLGPLAMITSVVVGWLAFAGTQGLDQASTFSMWVGSSSIVLMAWSFILALRIRPLERFWGGLDSMYRSHRWAGAVAVVLMFLHTQIEPETDGADLIRGASNGTADSAEDLAGTGELMLYGLVGISILRLIPYRWWRWTHKLLGLPFAFASWHFFTALKPYANSSGWGIWFASFMVAGLAAFVARVFIRDTVGRGQAFEIIEAETAGSLTRVTMKPTGSPLRFSPGQFAFLRVDLPGMREPHPFSIASGSSDSNLRFWIRDLGDWSGKLSDTPLLGAKVNVEGPYGEFTPIEANHPQTVWIAGGVGITPFLAALDDLGSEAHSSEDQIKPSLFYACREPEGDPLVSLLQEAHDRGAINLRIFGSGERLTPDVLREAFPDGMGDMHVALCGPSSLVHSMAEAASKLGAPSIETEDFDIRQGFGPDRSREIDQAVRSRQLPTRTR